MWADGRRTSRHDKSSSGLLQSDELIILRQLTLHMFDKKPFVLEKVKYSLQLSGKSLDGLTNMKTKLVEMVYYENNTS